MGKRERERERERKKERKRNKIIRKYFSTGWRSYQ